MKWYLSIIDNTTRRISDARLRHDPQYVKEITRNLDSARRDAHDRLAQELLREGFISLPANTPPKEAQNIARQSADTYINIFQTLMRN